MPTSMGLSLARNGKLVMGDLSCVNSQLSIAARSSVHASIPSDP